MNEQQEQTIGEIIVIGLGTGSPDSISLGAFNKLLELKSKNTPLYARTLTHPTVEWLKDSHQFEFTSSYDSLYETQPNFDEVYENIAKDLIAKAQSFEKIGFAVPGHPSFGETVVQLLRDAEKNGRCKLKIIGSQSYLDAVFENDSKPSLTSNLRVLDALNIIAKPDKFKPELQHFDPNALHLICQVYDKTIASELKLALLEFFPPDVKVCVVTAAGIPNQDHRVERELHQLDHSGVDFNHLTSVVIYPLENPHEFLGYPGLLTIMAKLRNPDGGCPWDIEQTPQSLRKYLIEEAYELADILDSNHPLDSDNYAQELGDILLQVVFHAQIARENGQFGMHDVIRTLNEKLIRRHPHVFADVDAKSSETVIQNWEKIKKTEKSSENRKSILDGVPKSMPALLRAHEISKRAAKVGFEWDSIDGVFEKLTEEINELHQAIESKDEESIESELGDLLFTCVNIARFRKIDSEAALSKMLERFSARFRYIENHAQSLGKSVDQLTQPEMEAVWQEAKMNGK